MRSISARSSAVSTMSAARTFSSRCLRDFSPGIGTIKAPAREPWAIGKAIESWASVAFFRRANVVRCHFLQLGKLGAQHPPPEHGISHHRHAKLLASVNLVLFFCITREQRIFHLKRCERVHSTATPE